VKQRIKKSGNLTIIKLGGQHMNINNAAYRLISLMEQEVQCYRELLMYLNEEARQLKSFSASELMLSGQKKEIVLRKLKDTREKSVEAFNELAAALNVNLEPLAISDLVKYLPSDTGLSLKLLKNQLNYYHQEVMNRMNLNAGFINECLDCWNSIMNVLHPEYLINYDKHRTVKVRSFTSKGISVNREI